MKLKLELKFVVNFPYKGGGGIWSRFAESTKGFLSSEDYVLINAYPLISKRGNFNPLFNRPILRELKNKYGPEFPNFKIILDFGKAFFKHFEGMSFYANASEFQRNAKKCAIGYEQLTRVWKPTLFTSIDLPTVRPPHIKIRGEERKPLFTTLDEAMKANHQILAIYESLVKKSPNMLNHMLISIQGNPKQPETYLSSLKKTSFFQRGAGFSVGSLTETKISTAHNISTLSKYVREFLATCRIVRRWLNDNNLTKEEIHLHFMGCGSFTKLPLIAYVFYDMPRLTVTTDLQTPVKRAAGNQYLHIEKGRYEEITDGKISTDCECKMCKKVNDASNIGSIGAYLNSVEGKEMISEDSGDTVRAKTVIIWHNILVHRHLAKKLSEAKTESDVLEITRKMIQLGLSKVIADVVSTKSLV